MDITNTLLVVGLVMAFVTLYNTWRIMSALDTLRAEVAETRTVMASAAVLISGLKARLDEAIAAAEAAGNMEALVELSASLDAGANDLAAAVEANTPPVTP